MTTDKRYLIELMLVISNDVSQLQTLPILMGGVERTVQQLTQRRQAHLSEETQLTSTLVVPLTILHTPLLLLTIALISSHITSILINKLITFAQQIPDLKLPCADQSTSFHQGKAIRCTSCPLSPIHNITHSTSCCYQYCF